MILVEAGARDSHAFEGKVLFAQQLADLGFPVVIDAETLPEKMNRALRYDIAGLLGDPEVLSLATVIVLGADALVETTMNRLRELMEGSTASLHAIGRFDTTQSEIHARTRLAYSTGQEPQVIDLLKMQTGSLPVDATSPLVFSKSAVADLSTPPRLTVVLPDDVVDAATTLPLLAAIDTMPGLTLRALVSGRQKEEMRRSRYASLSSLHYSELYPAELASTSDIVAFYGKSIPGERMALYAAAMIGAGKPVIDATEGSLLQKSQAPALVAHQDLGALPPFIESTVLPNAREIAESAQASPWARGRDVSVLLAQLGLKIPAPEKASSKSNAKTVFFPTNGHGIGHARRCSLIASELSQPEAATFTAFPSCISMIEARGFPVLPLVPRSDVHSNKYASDLITTRRLGRLVGPSDHLVFDGGHVFDSILHTISKTGCKASWIRRGLFRAGQLGTLQTDREALFDQVITPQECFDELNSEEVFRAGLKPVGPIVDILQDADPQAQRKALTETLGIEYDKLVVTMLGSGFSTERSAQLNALCLQLESRPDVLHLVVVWPGASVAPTVFQWNRTRVVRTLSSIDLCLAADFVISAAGYNSFHELLYNKVPAIFVPQVAPQLDDQARRAGAAAERGLALSVVADDFLTLERHVAEWLDTDKTSEVRKALEDVDLPEPGNARAAQLIEQVTA